MIGTCFHLISIIRRVFFFTDSVLLDLYVAIALNLAIMFLSWHFAKIESLKHSKSHHYNSKYCYSNCHICSHRWFKKGTVVNCWKYERPISMVVHPLKHKCCHKRIVYYVIPTVNGSPKIIRQLLLLAGDVEINPGPGNPKKWSACLI